MTLVASPTELTTSATDLVLAVECGVILVVLWRAPSGDRWRTGLWCWVFGLVAFAATLGSVVHGLDMPESMRAVLWRPLVLTLGVVVALFLAGALYDLCGDVRATGLVPWAIGVGIAFFVLREVLDQGFIMFVVYEAIAMVIALAIYAFLAATKRLPGSCVMAAAIVLNLLAAGVQASSLSFELFVPFDNNGAFHLVQMAAMAALGWGLWMGMTPGRLL